MEKWSFRTTLNLDDFFACLCFFVLWMMQLLVRSYKFKKYIQKGAVVLEIIQPA